ncbi:MAG: hypothetical protein HN348_02230 [Proteobacteria bacterium]|nr:hypothetical protein [Pseudomonadota bacterium]
MGDKMLIILTTGTEDRGNRATLAFSMGVAAQISGVETTIYMTMGGTVWSHGQAINKVHIDGFDSLATYIDQFVDLGGQMLVCSPCYDFYCSIAQAPLREGAELSGLTTVVDLALSGSVVTL